MARVIIKLTKLIKQKIKLKNKFMFPSSSGKYIYVKKIAQGGTGIVNLAIDTHSGYPVAIKSLFDSHFRNNPELLRKFKIEANIYLMLSHPNIVKLKDLILKDDGAHLVMDYVDGMSLDEYIKTVTGPIPSEVAIAMLKEIISAVGYAHRKEIPIPGYDNGVLHLDIKPSNILISKSGEVLVIDYGISEGIDGERSDQIIGSLMYMAPEQLKLESVLDHRTDIYSLGVLFHQMLTGSTPYSKNTDQKEIKKKIQNNPLEKMINIYPHVDIKLQKFIDIATAKDPKERFQSCQEMTLMLEKLENETI